MWLADPPHAHTARHPSTHTRVRLRRWCDGETLCSAGALGMLRCVASERQLSIFTCCNHRPINRFLGWTLD